MSLEFIDRSFSYTNLIKIFLLFGLGSIAGGFYYCLAMRIARGEDWKRGRSCCDMCGHILVPSDLIAVVSFLLLKGRCRYCGRKLSYRCLMTELFLGVVYVLTYLCFQRIDLNVLCLLNLFGLFLGLSLIDIETYIIPNGFIVTGIANRFFNPMFWLDHKYVLHRVFEALFLAGIICLLAWIMNKTSKKENLGGGDIKLIFVIGLYTGFYCGVWVLLVSSLIGSIYTLCTKKRRIPFGPFLSISAAIVLLYQGLI